MKKYQAKDIRNVALVGHKGAGKTSLAEGFLFNGKTTTRLGSVDNHTSTFDFDPEEMSRSMTISTALGFTEWKKKKINIIDTPGDGNFIYDTCFSMSAADAAILVVSAPDGVEVQTERTWERAKELNIPRILFINKMERERADPEKTLGEIQSMLSTDAIPVQLPIGKESEFKGIVDVFSEKAYLFEKGGSGSFQVAAVPDEYKDKLKNAKEALMEKIAESNDQLLEKYLEQGELSEEEAAEGFSKAILHGTLCPVFYGSASHNMGIHSLMDFVSDHLPPPNLLPPVAVDVLPEGRQERARTEEEPLLAFVFKTVEAQGGTLSIFRVLSGDLSSDSSIYNPNIDSEERVGTLLSVCGKKYEQISSAGAGDIGGVLKLKGTATGHTLCDKKSPVKFPFLEPPPPAISYAIKPASKGDEDKLGTCLVRILSEDPTLRLSRHEDTKDFLLSGMGAPHVEISIGKMKRRFGVDVTLETPKVPYRETITKTSQSQGRHKRQTGGRGQFGDVWLELSPLTRGGQFEFEDRIKGGVVPGQYIPAVEKGVIETLRKGILAGFPVVDIKVALYDGSYHDVDSSEAAFKRAASIGFKAAMQKAGPVMLEPIYDMEVVVPESNMGDIIGDLNSRRGRIQGMENKGKRSIVKAQVPLAEILNYSPDLDSRTGGRGSFTMQFSHYQEVPNHLTEKIISQHKVDQEEEE